MVKDRLRWEIEQSFEFIERQPFWNGVVVRREFAASLGGSLQQVSTDFARYRKPAAGNATCNRRARGYACSVGFQPRLILPDVAKCLARLSVAGDGVLGNDLSAPPDTLPLRWLAKPCCLRDGACKEFVLVRVAKPGNARPPQSDLVEDEA